jgi:hypothetical protein
LALGLGVTASRAAAEQILKGSFDLPTPAYWGSTLLQPGEYSFTVDETMARTPMVHLKGEGVDVLVLASPISASPVSERTYLTLENFNGVYAVRELNAGAIGASFDFSVSKAAKSTGERAEAITLPISASAGR